MGLKILWHICSFFSRLMSADELRNEYEMLVAGMAALNSKR